jgi:hypothetical protein
LSPPEILFLRSPLGGILVVSAALGLLAVTIRWARTQPDRLAAFIGGTATAIFITTFTFMAMTFGWWVGSFFEIPIIVLLAIEIPLQIAGYTLWLGWYRWLRRRTTWAWLIYGVVVLLLFVPTVISVDPIQMQRGQFSMGGGYTIWWDVLLGQVVMWMPVAFYEMARNRLVQTS